MRAFAFNWFMISGRRNVFLWTVMALLWAAGFVAEAGVPFTTRISADYGYAYYPDFPYIDLVNNSRYKITRMEMTIGPISKNFSYVWYYFNPPGGATTIERPSYSPSFISSNRSDTLILNFTSFDPGETIRAYVELNNDSGDAYHNLDFRTVFFNNGAGEQNAKVKVTDELGNVEELELLDPGAADLSVYTFVSESRSRTLTVKSVSEVNASDYVRAARVKINGKTVRTNSTGVLLLDYAPTNTDGDLLVGPETSITGVYDDDVVEVIAPRVLYKNIKEEDITTSVANDPQKIQDQAEERYVALGISVNDVPQTGDPTYYQFSLSQNTTVVVKWQHDYALTIARNFDKTISTVDPSYSPGLNSDAEGNPSPAVNKHWIAQGTSLGAQVDSQVFDILSHPGLDIRHVPVGYQASGPPSGSHFSTTGVNRTNSVFLSWLGTEVGSVADLKTNLVLATQRQSVPSFIMAAPGKITYLWHVQYGVKVNVDSASHASAPKVLAKSPVNNTVTVQAGSGEGTFWFYPGDFVQVLSLATDATLGLNGWLNGDGFYFTSSGTINTANGNPTGTSSTTAGTWKSTVSYLNNSYRGLEITRLERPARVLWTYGAQAIAVSTFIGQYVFQTNALQSNASYKTNFSLPPDAITKLSVGGQNPNVGDADMAIWDPEAKALYPLVPGQFRATWRTGPTLNVTNDVIVSALFPTNAHYPHVALTPPVALDPDPDDDFIFKALKYSENNASVDGDKRFSAVQRGRTVLLFSEIQRNSRGIPKEFLQVRVVDTRNYEEVLDTGVATIGSRITEPALDKAKFNSGYVMAFQPLTGQPDRARFNPFIYDRSKLVGIAAKDIYNMAKLHSTTQTVEVVKNQNLPGPIIPVNLHPGAAKTDRIVVVWYDNPADNDTLLWPYRAKIYTPQLPAELARGRIVIASQFGSESRVTNGVGAPVDQVVTPQMTIGGQTVPAESTYNPSRFQQVQIYHQPNPLLPGYNPNEEHALTAPSLRFASVSPRPPAIYALRNNDLNKYNASFSSETNQPVDYTSHPFVLVQFLDTADNEFKMKVYSVVKEDANIPGYKFANQANVTTNGFGTNTILPTALNAEAHVTMEAGEPVNPFYPLGVVIGASPCPETFGVNLRNQQTYWEDHKGTSWAVSGGSNAWFTGSFYYPLAPDFWWPSGKPGFIIETPVPGVTNGPSSSTREAAIPQVGDCISFLPPNVNSLANLSEHADVSLDIARSNSPIKVLYKSDWPAVAPVLKAGETLTFSGGEFRADHSTSPVLDDEGEVTTIQTPGLPGILAFASAEVVFDALNPYASNNLWRSSWTARATQVLDVRKVVLSINNFPTELQPANGRSRVKNGKFIFNDLPASLQKRIRFDPLATSVDSTTGLTVNGKLEMVGLLNDKEIGDATLTAAPPAVYVLEPNIMTVEEKNQLQELDNLDGSSWDSAVQALYNQTHNPSGLNGVGGYDVGLQPAVIRNATTGLPETQTVGGIIHVKTDASKPEPYRAFGPGLALVPNAGFLDPQGVIPGGGSYPDVSWITVAENNDDSLGGSPVTLHVIKVDRRERYRGAIKTILSDNVFDENLVLRHTGDFGANADDLFFEWWYRPDDGSLNVPPPDLLTPGQPNPWKLFPDPSGNRGQSRYQITMKGNPNAPEALLGDTFWFARYRHKNDRVEGVNWNVSQFDGSPRVNFTWAGAGNSDPFNDFDSDGLPDFRAQLAQGWIKRVLDAVNPYEARIRDFEGDNPSTVSSMIQQFGQRFEGPVALNPDKNVIENVGLIELYETILKRGSDFSIDLSQPVSTPAIANALQLASTRVADFYTILGNEAYTDALDPTIGFGSDSVEYGSLAPAVFAFQNQVPSMIEEELALLRGADDFFARPVYNRLFWNFTQGEGTAAYAMNYNISDINQDGFIDEDDAMILYPQGHGDAWGHYLTAIRHQYNLLRHPFFNWVSRSEFYNLQDIVIKVDFLDERKFAQMAAARAKTGAEIVNLTYRQHYVEDPNSQWQGYTDSNKDRAWGVQEWARRAGQGAYFDWVTANALLPATHPNETLEGIQRVDRSVNSDIAVIAANLNGIQTTLDSANKGRTPLGVSSDALVFDIDPTFLEVGSTAQIGTRAVQGLLHCDQIYERALKMLDQAVAVWDNANEARNMLRQVGNSELEFRNATYQEDLSYRNQLISLFGKPYEGTIGPGKLYPAGYNGPDLLLFMYVDVRNIDNSTVPGPAASFATFNSSGGLSGGDIYQAFLLGQGGGVITNKISNDIRQIFSSTFAQAANGVTPILAQNGAYAVNYTDLLSPKVALTNLTQFMPITAAGYTFQAPREWGSRLAVGELQLQINKMLQQEAQLASAVGAWDSLQGQISRTVRLINARLEMNSGIRTELESQISLETGLRAGELTLHTVASTLSALSENIEGVSEAAKEALPNPLPTVGFSFSPGGILKPIGSALKIAGLALVYVSKYIAIGVEAAAGALEITREIEALKTSLDKEKLEQDFAVKEHLVELENTIGDEPIKRIEIFKETQALREMSDEYRKMLDEATRLINERTAFNKRVAAQTQRNRYQDMTFRVARNHALQTYRAAFDLAARYAYLTAKAYDYETNFDPSDPGSPSQILSDIMRARTLGHFEGDPRMGAGGIAEALARIKQNYDVLKGQLGLNNPAIEIGKASLRTENYRILPKAEPTEFVQVDYVTNTTTVRGTGTVTTVTSIITAPADSEVQPNATNYGFASAGQASDDLWRKTLQDAVVDDLWEVPEFRYYCRPFGAEATSTNHVREPGIVLRFGTQITSGRNIFGNPLTGGDNTFDPSHYATKIQSVGVWFSDYLSGDPLLELPATPRVYLVPVGADVMSIPTSSDPGRVRVWKVVDQHVPVPFAATNSTPNNANWIPLLDSLNGRLGEPRKYSMFRAFADGGSEVNDDELVLDTRLVARSVWNTQWLLIIPGRMLNAEPDEGIQRFIDQVSDVKLVFRTYSLSGN